MSNDVIDLFDRVASRYDEVLPFFSSFGSQFVKHLPAPVDGGSLLDIGAGRGAIA